MKLKAFLIFINILFFSLSTNLAALDYTAVSSSLSELFDSLGGNNEGTTSFRSLLIPSGGRAESMGSAFTGLCDDVSFIDYNPAASSLLKETELALFHNSWIADSSMETIAGTTRFGNLGLGGKVSCFYVPFTEYDSFGERISGSYYSETCGALNISYHFFPGYTFKGIAIGANAKGAWRSVPDYADNDTGSIISGSGLEQSSLAVMADAGIMLQFNAAKFYNSNDANFKIGISASNIGTAFTGFGKKIVKDDPLPATFAIGFSYKFIRPLTFTLDFVQPVNLECPSEYQMFWAGSGVCVDITSFFSFLGGFQLKGANPRFSIGGEFLLSKFKLNATYTLDLTSSMNPVNRISASAKVLLGDKGRAQRQEKVRSLYNEGIYYFANREYDTAIEKWKAALKIDRYFDPAKTGIRIAREYSAMLVDMGNISTGH